MANAFRINRGRSSRSHQPAQRSNPREARLRERLLGERCSRLQGVRVGPRSKAELSRSWTSFTASLPCAPRIGYRFASRSAWAALAVKWCPLKQPVQRPVRTLSRQPPQYASIR